MAEEEGKGKRGGQIFGEGSLTREGVRIRMAEEKKKKRGGRRRRECGEGKGGEGKGG